jgi:hypothetical protein
MNHIQLAMADRLRTEAYSSITSTRMPGFKGK